MRTLCLTALSLLLCAARPCEEVSAGRRFEVSPYVGPSIYRDDYQGQSSAFAARLSVFQASTSHRRLGVEAGYLGLGSYGFGYADDSTYPVYRHGGHYNALYFGSVARLQTTGSGRLKAYTTGGVAPYLVRFDDTDDEGFPVRKLHFGASVGAGVYGLAPGMFGLEFRWHVIANARKSPSEPLGIMSLMAGLNF